MKKFGKLAWIGLFMLGPSLPALALETAGILPGGVRRASIRNGLITNLENRFGANSEMRSLGDIYSVHFDSATLIRYKPEAAALVNSLNQIGPYRIGDAVSLGTLRIVPEPEIRYTAPTFSYGITKSWTLGLGIPVVTFKNRMTVAQQGSNAAEIRKLYRGVNPELDSGLDRLNQSLVTAMDEQIAAAGYKPLHETDKTFLGDIQIVSLHRMHETARFKGLLKGTLILPTGPEDDPDDLADIAVFHRTEIGLHWLEDFEVLPGLILGGKAGGYLGIPDRITKRVPAGPEDSLPNASRKENLERTSGSTMNAGVGARYQFLSLFEAGIGLEQSRRSKDTYAGSNPGWNYGAVGNGTDSSSTTFKSGFDVTTVELYQTGRFAVPMMASYTYSDLYSGVNVQRQVTHEIEFTLFF